MGGPKWDSVEFSTFVFPILLHVAWGNCAWAHYLCVCLGIFFNPLQPIRHMLLTWSGSIQIQSFDFGPAIVLVPVYSFWTAPLISTGTEHTQYVCDITMTWGGGGLSCQHLCHAKNYTKVSSGMNQMPSEWKRWFLSLSDIKLHLKNCWTITQQWVLNYTPATAKKNY